MVARMLTLALVFGALAVPASAQATTCQGGDFGRYQVTHLSAFGMSCHSATMGLHHYLARGTDPTGFTCDKHDGHGGVTHLDCFGNSQHFSAQYQRTSHRGETE
jgi:hypothetical protein